MAFSYFSLTTENPGGLGFRSEAICGAKEAVARKSVSRGHPILQLRPWRPGPHLLSLWVWVWVWVVETLTQERKISSDYLLTSADTADITNRSQHSLSPLGDPQNPPQHDSPWGHHQGPESW